jgi:hypothetical protein
VDGQDSENQSTDANNTKDTNVPSMNLMWPDMLLPIKIKQLQTDCKMRTSS